MIPTAVSTQDCTRSSHGSSHAARSLPAGRPVDGLRNLLWTRAGRRGPVGPDRHGQKPRLAGLSAAKRERRGLSGSLIRLSVGLEDARDLIADLYQALPGIPCCAAIPGMEGLTLVGEFLVPATVESELETVHPKSLWEGRFQATLELGEHLDLVLLYIPVSAVDIDTLYLEVHLQFHLRRHLQTNLGHALWFSLVRIEKRVLTLLRGSAPSIVPRY